jgi:hypothetical protein
MPCTRLLLSAVLLCSLSVFAQNQWSERPPHVFFREGDLHSAPTSSEPWRIVPNQPANLNSAPDARSEWRIDDFKAFRGRRLGDDAEQLLSKSLIETLAVQDGLEGDTTCYTIRSYVVARDSKHSDATHAAGYSTCQPSTRFRLKSTVEHLRIPAK